MEKGIHIDLFIPSSVLRGGAIGAGAGAVVYVVLAGASFALGEAVSVGMSGETFGSILKKGAKSALPVLMAAGAVAGGFIAA